MTVENSVQPTAENKASIQRAERRASKAAGRTPEWVKAEGWALHKKSYANGGTEDLSDTHERVAKQLATHITAKHGFSPAAAESKFAQLLWDGYLAGSTPVIANTGLDNGGHSVSCGGSSVYDNLPDFFDTYKQTGLMTQRGYGTATALSNIRPRGAPITGGGVADGVVSVFDTLVQTAGKISQGCYLGDTQVYTSRGWRFFSELIPEPGVILKGLKILQVLDDGTGEFVTPTDSIKYEFEGDMVRFHGEGVDIPVTPNHRMTTVTKKGVYTETEADNLKITGKSIGVVFNTGTGADETDTSKALFEWFKNPVGETPSSTPKCPSTPINTTPNEIRWAIDAYIDHLGGLVEGSIDLPELEVAYAMSNLVPMTGWHSAVAPVDGSEGFTLTLDKTTSTVGKIKKSVVDGQVEDVYCFTVPSGRMLVRSNSHVLVCGNSTRRGAWCGYLDVEHPDFKEVYEYVAKNPVVSNIAWNMNDPYIKALTQGNEDAISIFQDICYQRCRTGKGFIWKNDLANRSAPAPIRECGFRIQGSNLCTEIALPTNEHYAFTCILSSINLLHWDKLDSDDIFWMMVFLDCLVEQTLVDTAAQPGFDRIHAATRDFRAVGLGALGYHSMLQDKMIPYGGLEAQFLNVEIFKSIRDQALDASQYLARKLGEPKFCEGHGVRNATLTAIAPNTSSALLCGGVSQGIEPIAANAYVQPCSAGNFVRLNPVLLRILKERGYYSEELMDDIMRHHGGSVQHLTKELTDLERQVLLTATEIDPYAVQRQVSQRQKFICQSQSYNVIMDGDEEEIANVLKSAILDPNIISVYYQRSASNIKGSTGACVACD